MTVFDFFKTRLRQAREWLLDYAYWVTLGAMIAVIVGTALYTDRLRQAENVQAGQSVVRGQPLGDVMAAVPAESELGAHLHLSLYRDGEAAEPTLPD